MEKGPDFNFGKGTGEKKPETGFGTYPDLLSAEAGNFHGRVHYTPEGTALRVRETAGLALPDGPESYPGEDERENVAESYSRDIGGLIEYVRDTHSEEEAKEILRDLERLMRECEAASDEETGVPAESVETEITPVSVSGKEDVPHSGIRAFLDKHPGLEKYFTAALLTFSVFSAGEVKTAEAGVKVFAPTRFERDFRGGGHYDTADFDNAYREARFRMQEWMQRKDIAADNIVEAIQTLQVAEIAFQRNLHYLEGKFDSRLSDIDSAYRDRMSLERNPAKRNALNEERKRTLLSERALAAEGISRMENDLRSLQSAMLENMDRNSLYSGSGRMQVLVREFEYNLRRLDAVNKSEADVTRNYLYDELSRYGLKTARPVSPAHQPTSTINDDATPKAPEAKVKREVVKPAAKPSVERRDYGGLTNPADQRLFDAMR